VGLFVIGITTTIIWWWYPVDNAEEPLGRLTYIWQAFRSIGLGLAAGFIAWMIAMPLAMALAYEQLQQKILRKQGVATRGESLVKGAASSARSLFSGIPGQIIWLLLTLLLTWTIPPLGVIAGAWSISHAMCRESYVSYLTLVGVPYKQRKQLLRDNRQMILWEGLSAACLKALLLISVVGWIFWLPAIFCGTVVGMKMPAVDDSQ
jgi:hypothetical protein